MKSVLEMTVEEAEEAGRKVAEWLRTPEGQAALEEGLARAKALSDKFREDSKIKDWTILYRPMTI